MLTSWREFKIGHQRPATEVRRLSRAGGSDGFERLHTVEHFMWSLAIGALVLGLLAATLMRYALSWQPPSNSDRLGALVLFIVVGLPFVIVGLAMVARYVWAFDAVRGPI